MRQPPMPCAAEAGDPQPASGIKRRAAQLGISRCRLEQACAFNNVHSSRVSASGGANGAGAWFWSLPSKGRP